MICNIVIHIYIITYYIVYNYIVYVICQQHLDYSRFKLYS